jgi:sulfur relay (sulfurtransferase) DsrC/TusE family protein
MVYVYEKQQWEYKIVASAMTEDELNTLGAEGWELVGVVERSATTQLYFKRVRA